MFSYLTLFIRLRLSKLDDGASTQLYYICYKKRFMKKKSVDLKLYLKYLKDEFYFPLYFISFRIRVLQTPAEHKKSRKKL